MTKNSAGDGVSYTDPRKNVVPKRRSELRPSEKELSEQHSFTKIPLPLLKTFVCVSRNMFS
jgi:hypothetical protein